MSDHPRQLRGDGAPRWDFLMGVLPKGINPTDIDLSYERRGQFLFLEGKRPGQLVPKGQQIYFDRLSALANCTVVRFEGTPPDQVERFGIWGEPMAAGNTEALRHLVRDWYVWAENEAAA